MRKPEKISSVRGDRGEVFALVSAGCSQLRLPFADRRRVQDVVTGEFRGLGRVAVDDGERTAGTARSGLSAELPHKTDAGGVIVGVEDGAGIRAAAKQIVSAMAGSCPGVSIDRVLVQQMATGGVAEALAQAIVAMSELAVHAPDVVEAEINPLLVGARGQGVSALDALVRRR